MGDSKLFTLFLVETTGFSVLGDARSGSLTGQKCTYPFPTRKSFPSRLPNERFIQPEITISML